MTGAGWTPDFVRWWCAPWELEGFPGVAARDLLGRRDGYRRWCAEAGIAPQLPPLAVAPPHWCALARLDLDDLLEAARLLGGLFAVRVPHAEALAGLDPDERRWCAGVASLQPLPRAPWRAASAREAGLTAAGLAWLALCLEQELPGLWPRLRLGLAAPLRAAVGACLQDGGAPLARPALARLARCWQLCLLRTGAADVN